MVTIQQDFIQAGRRNRPMTYPSSSLYKKTATHRWITIHNAYSPHWSAKQLHDYVKSVSCANRPASWHFSIDEKECYQALPLNESGWHAGDNVGPGNTQSIGIEICDYAMLRTPKDEKLFWQGVDHTAKLCAHLIKTVPTLHKFPDCLKQHNDWSGKNCPSFIRAKAGGWSEFVGMVKKYLEEPVAPEEDIWYRVIAGSYRDRSNAEKVRQNLLSQGIGAFIEVKK